MQIIKINRSSTKNARVTLDTGLSIVVPLAIAVVGNDIPAEDIISTEVKGISTYVYKTFYKEKRKPRVLPTIRDMSNFNATSELNLIKSRIRRHSDVFGRTLSEDEVNDLADDIFIHFWERGFFQGYDSAKLKYESYISRGVRNFCIDRMKSTSYRLRQKTVSLNSPIPGSEDNSEMIDFLEDPTIDIYKDLEASELLSKFKAIALSADQVGTGLVGVTYSQILNLLLMGDDLSSLAEETGYSRSTLINRKNRLFNEIKMCLELSA